MPAMDPSRDPARHQPPEAPEPSSLEGEAVPNPEVRQQEDAQRLASQHEEADTGRHAVDQSRPASFVRKSR
jgi:hypothetical protein